MSDDVLVVDMGGGIEYDLDAISEALKSLHWPVNPSPT